MQAPRRALWIGAAVAVCLTVPGCVSDLPEDDHNSPSSVASSPGHDGSDENGSIDLEAMEGLGRSGGQTGGEGSEVLPQPDETPKPLSEMAVEAPKAGTIMVAPVTASVAGLTEDFPAEVILVPDGSQVSASSVISDGDRVQVALSGSASTTCQALLIDYRSWLSGGGFEETSTSEQPSGTELGFERDSERVAFSAVPDEQGCRFNVLAALRVRS